MCVVCLLLAAHVFSLPRLRGGVKVYFVYIANITNNERKGDVR